MIRTTIISVAMLAALLLSAFGQYSAWPHTGAITILTTPDGANIPTGTSVGGFPLLVRLHKEWFDFTKAKVRGEDVRFSTSAGRMTMGEWVHVLHTYQKGDTRVYVNGVLDGTSTNPEAPLAIKSPARLWIGGWDNNYDFVAGVDEVRISNVVRSPEWARLQYENQKPLQTLVGPVVQPGSTFFAAPERATVMEGGNRCFHRAGGRGAEDVLGAAERRAGDDRVNGSARLHL